MIEISVIIPHKNCVDILKRCINSIPNRPNIEIIVVDDNSENQLLLKKEIADLNYSNLQLLLTNEEKGAGFARNVGLERAKGTWLCFADADDLFTDNAFDIINKYKESSNDIVYFYHKSVYSDTLLPCVRFDDRNENIKQCLQNRSQRNMDNLRFKDVVPWSKIIRREIVEKYQLRFDEVPASNDVMFVMQAGFYAKNIDCSSDILYTATYREGSITRVKSIENIYSSFCVALRYNNFVRLNGYSQFTQKLFGRVFLVFREYGVKEALRFIVTAHKHKQWLFTGGFYSINKLKSILHFNDKDKYKG